MSELDGPEPEAPGTPLLPVYLVLDASGSTARRGWLQSCNLAIAAFAGSLVAAAGPGCAPLLSVLSYGDRPSVQAPLMPPAVLGRLPVVEAGGLSSLAGALAELAALLVSDAAQLEADGLSVVRPTVVLVADGLPTDPAEEVLSRLAGLAALGEQRPCLHGVHPAGTDRLALAGIGLRRSLFVPADPSPAAMEAAFLDVAHCEDGCLPIT